MEDRLVWLLKRSELRASVFQAGPLQCRQQLDARSTSGYLHLLQSGRVRVIDEHGSVFEIDEPSAFFYMNPMTHRLEPVGEDTTMVCSSFEFGIGQGNPLQSALPELFILRLAGSPGLRMTLEQLFKESDEEHCGREAILDRLSEVALILILRDLMDEKRLDIGLLAGLADAKLSRAINAIHARPDEDWTLDKLAGTALMSRDWRLGLAKTLLLKGLPVQQIATDVGYGSASALSRVFSSRCGVSPTQWRRTALAD